MEALTSQAQGEKKDNDRIVLIFLSLRRQENLVTSFNLRRWMLKKNRGTLRPHEIKKK